MAKGIRLFRGDDAPGLFESGIMSFPVFDPGDQRELADEPPSSKVVVGTHDEVLLRDEATGFSLVRVWFGPHYVLPRHTHSADCLYYVVKGSLTMGNQVLEAGEGFLVPEGAPYGYEAGPDGVEVLEFRNRTSFDMQIPGGQVERLRRMSAAAEEHGERWEELKAQRVAT